MFILIRHPAFVWLSIQNTKTAMYEGYKSLEKIAEKYFNFILKTIFSSSAVLSFIGVYLITGNRDKVENVQPSSEERQELLSGMIYG